MKTALPLWITPEKRFDFQTGRTLNAIFQELLQRMVDDVDAPVTDLSRFLPFLQQTVSGVLNESSDLLNGWETQGRPCSLDRLLDAVSAGPRRILGGEDCAAAGLLDDAGSTVFVRTAEGWTAEYDVLKEGERDE